MRRHDRIRSTRVRRAVLWIGGIVLAALLATPAFSHPRGHAKKYKPKHHDRMHHTRVYAPPPMLWTAPPVRLDRRDSRHYRNYFVGSVWFGPHRHVHALYEFPIAGRAGHRGGHQAYCEGRLFLGRAYREPRPRFRVSVVF